MKNMKIFSKIATALVGMAMAIGVGVAVSGNNSKEVRAGDVTDNLTASDFEAITTSYVDFSGVTKSSDAVYAGNSAKDASGNIQMRSKSLNSGIVSTSSGGKVKSVKITVGSGSNTINVYGSNTAYSSAADLYGASAGTLIGSVAATGTVNFSNDYEFVGIRSNNGAIYVASVEITWTSGDTPTDPLESITVSGSMTKTSYYVGESWSSAGLTATGHYESGESKDVTGTAIWSFSPTSPDLSVTSVVATATIGTISGNSSAQSVTVSKTNPIQVLYTKSSGAVDVYGYYVGFLDGTGPVIMDGEYGIVVYNKTADVSGYTEGETILHVTGSITIFNGLYEIGSPSISVASGTFDLPSTPVVYAAAGGETQEYASRLTTVTGTPTLTKGSFDSVPGTADITMSFDLGGGKSVQVFYKKAAQTADSEAFTAIKTAVTDSTEITVKGFTGWYNGFQVQMNGYVKPAEDYTAEDFSQDLLDQTDAVCKDYDDVTNNHDAIEAIWSNLASNDKYPSLPADQKTILANATRDESGTVVEQAMARYDYLTGKYGLSNFINGRTPVAFAAQPIVSNSNINSSMSIVVVAVIAITSLSAIGVLLVIKRRKSI